jgi:hypothetical protein
VALPRAPRREDHLPFFMSSTLDMRFFVDRHSISAGADGVVRFSLIALSAQGAENISFEGVRCKSGEYKTYAIARADGSWSQRESKWRRTTQPWQQALRAEFFCPQGVPITTAAEGVDALRRGGHPNKGHTSRD